MFRNFAVLGFIITIVGCGTAPDVGQDDEESEAAISTSWEKLAGAWEGQGGGIGALVLERTPDVHGHHFFADVDNGIRCITTPCPSVSRLEGYYTATTKNLWLHVTSGSSGVNDYAGKYTYKFSYLNGKYLQLSKDGETQSLKYVPTYCAEADDCAEQDFVHILCVGHFTCKANHCGYSCGVQQGTKCGSKTCGAGTYCCNPVMSICAPNGGYCIQ